MKIPEMTFTKEEIVVLNMATELLSKDLRPPEGKYPLGIMGKHYKISRALTSVFSGMLSLDSAALQKGHPPIEGV